MSVSHRPAVAAPQGPVELAFPTTCLLRDLALQHILEGLADFSPSFFIYDSRNGGLDTTGPSKHLGKLLFSSLRPGNGFLVFCTSIGDLRCPRVTKNNLRLVVRDKSSEGHAESQFPL